MIRIGVIGLGFGSKVHIPAFLLTPGIEIAGIASSRLERAEKVREDFRQAGEKWKVLDWRTLISLPEIDAVSVVVPPTFQHEIVCAALTAGKHVLCEKPFGLNLREAQDMLETARRQSLVNVVDFQFRMDPFFQLLRDQIRSGRIGEIYRIHVAWLTGGRADPALPWSWQYDASLGGGVLFAFGSHVFDYIGWLCSSPIASVLARLETRIDRRMSVDGWRQATAEDTCDILCSLDNRIAVNITISNVLPRGCGHRIEIYGDLGRLVYHHSPPFLPDTANVFLESNDSGLQTLCLPSDAERSQESAQDSRLVPFLKMSRSFVAAISGAKMPDLPDFSDGVRVQRVMAAIRQSASQGCVVEIPVSQQASKQVPLF